MRTKQKHAKKSAKKSVKKLTKPKYHFTIRQLKYKKNRLLGMSQYDAAVAAGYSHATSRHACQGPERVVKSSIIDELNRSGSTDYVLAREFTKLALTATKLQVCNVLIKQESDGSMKVEKVGSNLIEVPDLYIRKDALETIAKLKKHLIPTPLIDNSEHTHLTLVIEGSLNEQRDQDKANAETELSIRPPNESV